MSSKGWPKRTNSECTAGTPSYDRLFHFLCPIIILFPLFCMHTPSKGSHPGRHEYHHKCVCEICTCGKHTCPPKTLPFEGETTHSHDYKPYKLAQEQQERLAYNPEQRHYDANLIQTTYNSNYTPHRIEQDRLLNPMQAYVPSRGKFEGETEYTKSYVPNQIRMDRQPDVLKYVPNSAKFDASTTYNREYSPKHAAQQSSSGKGFEYRPSNLPFEGKTTYESEYKPHQISPTRIEGMQYHPKNTPFVGESRYKEVRMQRLSNMCHTSYNPPSYVPTTSSRLDRPIVLQAKNTYNSQQPGTNGSDLSILSNIIKEIKYNRNKNDCL